MTLGSETEMTNYQSARNFISYIKIIGEFVAILFVILGVALIQRGYAVEEGVLFFSIAAILGFFSIAQAHFMSAFLDIADNSKIIKDAVVKFGADKS